MPIISYFPTSDKESLEGKQDRIKGIKGQVVGFDDKGNAVAQAAPDTGVITFNGRAGAVVPQDGDYTPKQVGAAPISHTAAEATYGAGSGSSYGHVKLSDSVNDANDVSSGVAATPKAVKAAYDLANKALEAAGEAKEYTEEILKDLFGGELPDPVLANNSPEVIQRAAYLGLGANFWSVGDSIPITLNGTVGALTFNEETYYPFIIGFNHNAALEGGNGIDFQFGRTTSAGNNFAFVDANYNTSGSSKGFRMNTSSTTAGGWENSYMRKTICPEFFAALPAEWQNIIIPCIKYTDNVGGGGNDPSYVTSTKDEIFLLSQVEHYGAIKSANSAEQNFQKQYDYYKNGNRPLKYRHNSLSTTCFSWQRSPNIGNGQLFTMTSNDTTNNGTNGYANSSVGFAPCFRIGASKGEQAA